MQLRGQELFKGNKKKAKAWVTTERGPDELRLVLGGKWLTTEIADLDKPLDKIDDFPGSRIEVDAAAISRLDSAGAWLLVRTRRSLEKASGKTVSISLPEHFVPLIETVERTHDAAIF